MATPPPKRFTDNDSPLPADSKDGDGCDNHADRTSEPRGPAASAAAADPQTATDGNPDPINEGPPVGQMYASENPETAPPG